MNTTDELLLSSFDFSNAFKALTGHRPFPWQRRLFDAWLSGDGAPSAVDIPTGLGKTAVMAVWLLARGAGANLPRRLIYVVDRRAVVDQATASAKQIRDRLEKVEDLKAVRRGLGLSDGSSLPISTLRGRFADNREWMADPSAAAIIVGTVDMVGSRLLFEGYGVSRRMRPHAAGLMGCDSLVLLDEAHLARPFERLLQAIEKGQRVSPANGADTDTGTGAFIGPAASAALPPPFRVLPLSATPGHDAESKPFGLDGDDIENETVRTRLDARKILTVEPFEDDKRELADELVERAWQLMWKESSDLERPVRVVVYCDRRKDAEKVGNDLRRRVKDYSREEANEGKLVPEVILFVGGRRVHEREQAARQLEEYGLIASDNSDLGTPVFLVATSAGEVGIDLDADHMVCDLVAWERMVQRLGRVNRRGMGRARVLVIDEEPSGDADEGKGFSRSAVRLLLESLPRDDTGERQAGPAALAELRADPDSCAWFDDATTRPPLYPPLTRPLVDAWAMTSLVEHAGRPEVGPWLRGWVDDEPQTTLVWRRYLPVRSESGASGVGPQGPREVEAFFEAAPPHTHELLETETRRVVEWLGKRVKKLLKPLTAEIGMAPGDDDHGVDDDEEAVEDGDLLAPMKPDAPVAFLLDSANRPEDSLSLSEIDRQKKEVLSRRLAGKRLVVDARFGGIENGLLADGSDGPAPTLDNDWESSGERGSEEEQPSVRVEILRDESRARRLEAHDTPDGASGDWREVLALPYRVSAEGDPVIWLTIEKRRGGGEGEEARAIAPKVQLLAEHQAWAAREAARIAEALGLDEDDRAMLVAAAAHHDDGKMAARWQRAFSAPRGDGPYGKTAGPFNRHVLNGYRHELKSTLDAEKDGLDGVARSGPRFDMALHLIAAHHGQARPGIGVEGYDDLPPSAAAARAHRIGVRFARLQRQWGPWGLAWWEALLRAADQSASRRLEESGFVPGAGEAS